jgi:hypothetical protein
LENVLKPETTTSFRHDRLLSEFRKRIETRVARWFVFKPKIPILVKFGGPWSGQCCYILFGTFYGYLVQSIAFWYSLLSFGILIAFWYVPTKKNLATLIRSFHFF